MSPAMSAWLVGKEVVYSCLFVCMFVCFVSGHEKSAMGASVAYSEYLPGQGLSRQSLDKMQPVM